MIRLEELLNWFKINKIKFEQNPIKDSLFSIDGENYLLVEEKNGLVIDIHFNLILSEEENKQKVDGYIFNFGGKFFYTKSKLDVKLKLLKYIGLASQEIDIPFTHFGVHGPYEMLNGAFQYEDWVRKAKFLGHNSLGICEKNSLSGIFQFQKACKENNIKPIIGETITVKFGKNLYDFKVYVLDKVGYKNLLAINKFINIDNESKFISMEDLLNCTKGLILVIPNNLFSKNSSKTLALEWIAKIKLKFEGVYYQLDTVIWDNKNYYLEYLGNIKWYLDNLYPSLEPILINDSYYLDEEDAHIKKTLNAIGGEGFQNTSRNQYFKNLDDSFKIFEKYFASTDSRLVDLLTKAIKITQDLGEEINFEFKGGTFHLPKFTQGHLPEEYKLCYGDNEVLFDYLITDGLFNKKLNKNTEYIDRVNIELAVIKKGGFVDYFLILWDIIRFCKEKNILTGLGRGSAAGSLIAYLLDITRVDPLKYDLLFERFLNEGRLNSPPDIDTDISTNRREEVFNYVKEIYGKDYFCNVGTYTTLQIKSGIRDLAKLKGLNYDDYNHLTTFMLDFPEGKGGKIEELFYKAIENPKVREFIQSNVDLIHDLFLILEQPKAISIHPCATIILPKEEGTIFTNIPTRKDGNTIISEFEGPDLEKMGYLKEDLLALLQLDKFERILSLIKENHNKEIDIYSIELDDQKVMDMFRLGLNGDVFQFGSPGLTDYSKQVKPDNIGELVDMLALYRPGPIGSGAHHSYVHLKYKKREVEYDFGLEEVTKNTYGLIVYQEQVMKAVQVLGGFSLTETDDVRRAMGKKKEEVLLPFKAQFLKGALSRGASEEEASNIWDKLIIFSAYGFNRSHAVVYAVTGYISQWLKTYHPLEFWTAALEYSKNDEKLISYINEINKKGDILIVAPDINKSEIDFKTDSTNNKIYWSISKIKFLGEIGTASLLEERNKNGKYFSIEEFYLRVKETALDKRMISNLIFSGCFDEICGVLRPIKRIDLLKEYFKIASIDEGKELWLQDKGIKSEWWWILKQRELTGLGLFDFRGLVQNSDILSRWAPLYLDGLELQEEGHLDQQVCFAGIVKEVSQRKSKNGPWLFVKLDSNGEECDLCIWNGEFEKYKELISDKIEKKIFIFLAFVRRNKEKNVLHFHDPSDSGTIINPFEVKGFEDLTQYKPVKIEYKIGDIRTFKDGDYQLNNQNQWKKIKKG